MFRQSIRRPPVYRIALIQLGLTAILTVLFLFKGPQAAISALAGGLTCTIPNAYFMYKTFLYMGARQVQLVMKSFYQGGGGKLILTMLGFGLTYKFLQPVDYLALFLSFALVQGVMIFAAKIADL
ncbi:MAG: ATP synthase subunit I [Oceanospirillaceae bacterium]|nr:ATP synthase subunit I [Oceanospirillaceae bacterium]MCP5334654.1 ATP synthase subunit I [Oceanospirillaceae bacterium]MCP5351368.1 ATP synthase subunit I [Oceanospirillaceae bacterium]